MYYLAIFLNLVWTWIFFDAFIGMKRLKKLEKQPSRQLNNHQCPLITIIISAKNEETELATCLASLQQQDYPNLELIIINDRSNDATGDIIHSFNNAANFHEIHIKYLPDGWLGKNYALHQGYLLSSGEYLLFTDADVRFSKDTVSRAIQLMQLEELDHLTLAPHLIINRFWAKAFISYFLFNFSFFRRPWKANDDQSTNSMGVGAFNLVTRNAYKAMGTHQHMKGRPDDDLMLGELIKKTGGKQRLYSALEHVHIPWYKTLKEAIVGFEKNVFAGLYYSYILVLFTIFGVLFTQIGPIIGLFITTGIEQFIFLTTIVVIFLTYWISVGYFVKKSLRYFPVYPISVMIFLYMLARAMYLMFKRKGIIWRGTFYSLNDIKKQS